MRPQQEPELWNNVQAGNRYRRGNPEPPRQAFSGAGSGQLSLLGSFKEPFNVELEELAHGFAGLLRPMVATVDRFGLKAYHLRRHKFAVERFR
jgi:hypothetical protein